MRQLQFNFAFQNQITFSLFEDAQRTRNGERTEKK